MLHPTLSPNPFVNGSIKTHGWVWRAICIKNPPTVDSIENRRLLAEQKEPKNSVPLTRHIVVRGLTLKSLKVRQACMQAMQVQPATPNNNFKQNCEMTFRPFDSEMSAMEKGKHRDKCTSDNSAPKYRQLIRKLRCEWAQSSIAVRERVEQPRLAFPSTRDRRRPQEHARRAAQTGSPLRMPLRHVHNYGALNALKSETTARTQRYWLTLSPHTAVWGLRSGAMFRC